jgi:hypothetical protein
LVDGPLHGSEDSGNRLPIVQKDGLLEPAKRRILVGPEGGGLS